MKLLADKVHKQEPQRVAIRFTRISSSGIGRCHITATYVRMVACVKRVATYTLLFLFMHFVSQKYLHSYVCELC